jgi:16S rRNA (uracil1498-N3)-methyltransferase
MPRFYCPVALASGSTLLLPADAARHVQVLRLQPGDQISLFNTTIGIVMPGTEFEAVITRMGRHEVEVKIGAPAEVHREPNREVHLAVGVPANERMDWLIEKATELGVTSIQPLTTQHSVVRLSAERAPRRQSHWQSIAIAACEQSGGCRIPVVHPVQSFDHWVANWRPDSAPGSDASVLPGLPGVLLCLRTASKGLREQVGTAPRVLLCVGPEGGWSRAEEDLALRHGFCAASMGPRTLRTETAAVAAVAQLVSFGAINSANPASA